MALLNHLMTGSPPKLGKHVSIGGTNYSYQ